MRIRIAVITAVLLAATHPAAADDVQEVCAGLQETAELVMQLRQDGKPMADMMGALGSNQTTRAMVTAAYNTPQWQTPRVAARETRDFGNRWAAACYERYAEGAHHD